MLLFLCAILLGTQNCNKNSIGSAAGLTNFLRPPTFLQFQQQLQPQLPLNRKQRSIGICENATDLLKLEPHPSNCNKFYMCLTNYAEEFSCPAEHYFDSQYFNCIKGTCHQNEIKNDKPKVMTTTNNNNNNNKNIYMDDDECQTNTLMRDENDCTAFYICLQGRFWRMNCPPLRFFDTSIAKCQQISHDNVQYKCSCKLAENTLLANSKNITTYYKCNNGGAQIRACNVQQYFNASLNNCVTMINNSDDNNEIMKIITKTTTNNDCINFNNNEKKSHANSCNKYLMCLNGRVVTKMCPINNYFDAATKMCLPDVNNKCEQTTTTTKTKDNGLIGNYEQSKVSTTHEALKNYNNRYEKFLSKFLFF